jgi:hypothetical protein
MDIQNKIRNTDSITVDLAAALAFFAPKLGPAIFSDQALVLSWQHWFWPAALIYLLGSLSDLPRSFWSLALCF